MNLLKFFLFALFLLFGAGIQRATANDIDTVWMRWMPTGHSVSSVRFSPDDTKIAAFSEQNNAVAIVDVASGNIDTILSGFKWGEYSADGQFIYSTNGRLIYKISTIDYSRTTPFDTAMAGLVSISISDNGFIACKSNNGFQVWNLNTRKIIFTKNYEGINPETKIGKSFQSIILTKDGKYLLSSLYDTYLDYKGNEYISKAYIEIFDPLNLNLLRILEDNTCEGSSSSSKYVVGHYLKIDNHENISRNVFDLETNQIALSIPGYGYTIPDIAFSPDDKYIALAYSNLSKIEIWDIVSKKIIYTYEPGGYSSVDITSDGKYLIGSLSNLLVLWPFDTKTSTEENHLIYATITYPNPSQNIFNLEFILTIPNLTNIDLIDLTGNTVKVIENKLLNYGNHSYPVDISDLPIGAYILRIHSGNFSYYNQIIKN